MTFFADTTPDFVLDFVSVFCGRHSGWATELDGFRLGSLLTQPVTEGAVSVMTILARLEKAPRRYTSWKEVHFTNSADPRRELDFRHYPIGQVQVQPLNPTRVQVRLQRRPRIEVDFPGVRELLDDLENELQEAYQALPVTATASQRDIAPAGRGRDTLPRVPSKPRDFNRWCQTWPAIKSMVLKNDSYEEIATWLKKMHPKLAAGVDTLPDIIKAGLAGLLERTV